MHTLAPYIFAMMQVWAPFHIHDHTGVPRFATMARYWGIASDLETVVFDPEEAPLFDDPAVGRAETAVLILAIASYESGGFRADVDREDKPTGDGGHAWCLGQLHDQYASGLTDRVSCFRGMLHALRDSWSMCHSDDGDVVYRTTGYTVGHCEANEPGAELRVKRARDWWSLAPWLPPVS